MIRGREWFATSAVNSLLGLQLVYCGPDRAEVSMPVRSDFIQEQNVVHGGLLTLLADTAAVYLTLPLIGQNERMTSIELKVNFLDAAIADRGDLRAVAVPVKAGRRVIVAESSVYQADRRILTGLFTYLRFQ